MSSLFDFDKPAIYAVMGNPVSHSKSPRIHGLFAEQTGQRIQYTAIQVDPGGFEQAVRNFVANGGRGLNITVPFKTKAWELVDSRTPRASLAGAVNTIEVRAGGVLHGDNTDGVGLVRDIVNNQGGRIADKSVLLLGAGGAARGVLSPLLEQSPAELVIANRTEDRAVTLAQSFSQFGPVKGCGFDDLAGRRFDLVVNATSASLQGEVPPLPDGLLAPGAWCYDMMYGAAATPFIQWAERHGAQKVADGLGMLVEQAAESFLLWRKVRPQTAPVIAALRAELSR
ncbi:MAG: shikimate dehydrogenase [Gammaproteobacteria bacterium]|jgi:shikimate dehydrogenase